MIWKPDTCECEIEFETWETPNAVFPKVCDAHKDVPVEELWGVIYGNDDSDMKVKHKVLTALLEKEELADTDERGVKQLKKDIKFDWNFSGTGKERVFNFEVKGATLDVATKEAIVTKAKEGLNKEGIINII